MFFVRKVERTLSAGLLDRLDERVVGARGTVVPLTRPQAASPVSAAA
jgi:hypothetical protein